MGGSHSCFFPAKLAMKQTARITSQIERVKDSIEELEHTRADKSRQYQLEANRLTESLAQSTDGLKELAGLEASVRADQAELHRSIRRDLQAKALITHRDIKTARAAFARYLSLYDLARKELQDNHSVLEDRLTHIQLKGILSSGAGADMIDAAAEDDERFDAARQVYDELKEENLLNDTTLREREGERLELDEDDDGTDTRALIATLAAAPAIDFTKVGLGGPVAERPVAERRALAHAVRAT